MELLYIFCATVLSHSLCTIVDEKKEVNSMHDNTRSHSEIKGKIRNKIQSFR